MGRIAAYVIAAGMLLACAPATGAAAGDVRPSLHRLPLRFEENRGQAPASVAFLARAPGYVLQLTTTGLAVAGTDGGELELRFSGASPNPSISGDAPLAGRSHYFLGDEPRQWQTDVRHFARVAYRDLYPGIDVVFYGNQRQVEYDFVVAPGADPASIRLHLGRSGGGAAPAHLDADGRLVLDAGDGALHFEAPISYQEIDGRRVAVASRFVLAAGDDGAAVATIALGEYDRGRELVIDPVLVYSGYYGGGGNEEPRSIAVDPAGNWYVTGVTASANFPLVNAAQTTRPATLQPPRSVGFVLKLNPAGTQVIYATYLEGSTAAYSDCRFERAGGIGIGADAGGNAYVAGNTCHLNFPGALNEYGGGGLDSYVAKLGPNGNVVWSRYLGQTGYEKTAGLAVDAAGNSYVAGKTETADFPTTAGAWIRERPQAATPPIDGYALKLGPDGGVVWSTYVGGEATDEVRGVAIDGANPPNVFVGGYTESMQFPTTAGSYQPQRAGGGVRSDAFVVKLNPAGTAPVYSTYFGGPSDNDLLALAVGPQGRAYFVGSGVGTDLPLPPSPIVPFDAAARNGRDYLAVLSESGGQLLYSTYFPISASLAVRADGVAYLTGNWSGDDFPFRDAIQGMDGVGCPGPCPPGAAFVSWIRPSGQADQDLIFSTYLAGNHVDGGNDIAVDAAGNAYVVGITASTDFPEAGFPVQDVNAGSADMFLAKIAPSPAGPTATATPTATVTVTSSRTATATAVATPTRTATATITRTAEPTGTASVTAAVTRTITRTPTITRTRTGTPTASPTVTPTPELCGNGRLDGDEECDAGADNSDVLPNTCRTLCRLPGCGDKVTDDEPPNDESCDDGNREDDDGCPSDCKLGIQLRPFVVVGRGLCSNEPVDVEVREVPTDQVISADADIEYQWVKRGPDAGTLDNVAARVLEAALNRFIAASFRAMGRDAPPTLPIATMSVRKIAPNRAQVEFADGEAGYGINVLRAVRKRDGTAVASNIALVLNGLKLDGESALDIEPLSPLNVAGQAMANLFSRDLEDPPMILFSGGLLCDGSGTFPAGTGVARVKSITFNLFGGRIKDVDLFEAVKTVIGFFPPARGMLGVLAEGASLGRGVIASQFLDFEVSSKAAMDAEEASGRTQTEDDVIEVSDELSTDPPFFKGVVTAKQPGISAVQATLDLERYCMGKSDDSFLVLVGPRLEKAEIRNQLGQFESPMRVPLNGTRQPHAVAMLNGVPATGPVTIAFDPIDATGDRVTEFRRKLTRLIPGADQMLNEISGSVQMTVPPGAMLHPTVGLYREGNTFIRLEFTYKPFEGTITIDELKIQIPVPNVPVVASWRSIAPPDPVVNVLSPGGATTGLKRGMGEIKVDVCLPLFNVADPATRMATLPVVVIGEEIIIAGRKFDDSDGNGRWDEGEPFLRGWTIEITDAFGAVVASQVTNEDGNYLLFVEKEKFPRDTTEFGVREVPQPGWSATDSDHGVRKGFRIDGGAENVDFGNFRDLDLSGTKFHDRDGDGVRGAGEEGLANWVIEITDGSGRVHRKFTDPDGRYEIDLPFDFFRGDLPITVRELPQSRWTATFPKGGGPVEVGGLDSGLRSGQPLGVNFGNFHDVRLEGRKFEDANGNRIQDAGEPGLADWTIEFVDSFGRVRRAMTDSDGDYFFRLPLTVFKGPLTARVREVQQPGWAQTFPAGDGSQEVPAGTPLLSDGRYRVNFGNRRTGATPTAEATETPEETETPGGDTETPTPTVTRTPASILTGVKYEDLNGNGRRDVSEPRLRDWVIFLDDNLDDVLNNAASGDGVCDQHAEEECKFTDAAGVYAFVVGSGLYRVREVQQPGWVQSSTSPPDVFVREGGGFFPLLVRERAAVAAVRVSLATGPQSFQFLDFGNFRLGNAPGVTFEDRNGDGRQDATEPGLAGWTIYDDGNENARLDAGEVSVETGRDGAYLFRGLRAGRHVLREVPRCGYRQTLPGGNGAYEIDAASGADIGVRDFGNQPPPALPGDGNRDGVVSAADLVATTSGLRGGRQHALMDANEDGRVDPADLRATGGNIFACGDLTAPVAPLATLTPTRGTPTPPTVTATPTRSAAATPTVSPTGAATPTRTAVATPSPTSPASPSRTTTRTPSPTPSATPPTGSPTPGSGQRCRELPPAPIPDGDETGLDDVLTLGDATVISDLNLRLRIDHSFVGDLVASLTHVPSGTRVLLLNQPGSGGGGFGCDGSDVDVLLDDEAASPAQDACAQTPPAIGGTLRPFGGLDAFDGETMTGEWRLIVLDLASGDEGALVRWCLEVNDAAQPTPTPTRTPTPQSGSLRQCFQPSGVLEIPDDDPAGATADIVVTNAVQVNDLNVSLDIAHTWVGDLVVQLTHLGSGRTATLIDRPGAPELSPGGCDLPDIDAVLDDEAGAAAEDQCDDGPAPSGNLRPSQSLSLFDGISATGTWRLKVADSAPGDVGAVNGWCIGVNRSPTGP